MIDSQFAYANINSWRAEKGEKSMAKDYFKDCKAITNTVLEYLVKKKNYSDNLYYTIDILNVDGETAKVMVCEDCLTLTKEQGNWTVPAAAEM